MPTNKEPPFAFDYYYPSKFDQIVNKVYNIIFNILYPIQPSIASFIFFSSIYYYFYKYPSISIAGLISAGLAVTIAPVIVFRSFLYLFFFRYKGHLFELPNRPSITTRFWRLCYQLLRRYFPPRLLTCCSLLPKQPVPSLEYTVSTYIKSMELLLEPHEFERLKNLSKTFLSVEGPKLQSKAYLLSWLSKNYVTPFWEEFAYLRRREPLLINTSVSSTDFIQVPPDCTQASRGAHIAYLTTLQMLSFGDESQSPPADGLMYSGYYKRLFASSRIPGKEVDEWAYYGYSRHIVIISKGCFYRVDMFDPETNKIYRPEQITDIFTELLERDEQVTEAEQKVGALAHDYRIRWAENRNKFFLNNPTNAFFLHQIESSIFVLVFDEAENYGYGGDDQRLSNFARSVLTGNGSNRWPDKPMNMICAKNGRAACCAEHSFADGPEYVHFMENLFGTDTHFMRYPTRRGEKLKDYISHLKPAQRLHIDLVDGMESEIQRCFDQYTSQALDVDISSTIFNDWGKERIKLSKCSPDAFIQMAIQLAYFKDQGKFVPTYEAAANRFYDYSRTETIRTVTKQSCKFVHEMCNQNKDFSECAKLLVSACKEHQFNSKLAMTGKGIDRHLFVLYILSKGIEKSEFLDDYIERNWILSTTQTPYLTNIMDENNRSDQERWMGATFAPVTKNGYGIAYHFIGNNRIVFHISSFHSCSLTSSVHLRKLIIESLAEMIELF